MQPRQLRYSVSPRPSLIRRSGFPPKRFRHGNFSELLSIYSTLLDWGVDMLMVSISVFIVLVFAIGASVPPNHDIKFFR
jgi:hypothetical protein